MLLIFKAETKHGMLSIFIVGMLKVMLALLLKLLSNSFMLEKK